MIRAIGHTLARLWFPAAVALVAAGPVAADVCFSDIDNADVVIDGAHRIDWAADPGAQGYCRVVSHYTVFCDKPTKDAECLGPLHDGWGTKVARVEKFVFNDSGKYALVHVKGAAACDFAEGETRYLKLDGVTCVFRPATAD